MDRKTFLLKTFYICSAMWLAPNLVQAGRVFANTASLNKEPVKIKETNLIFGPLTKRTATNLIVVHHIGNTDEDVSAAEVHKWHLANGWAGIGYHYLIRKDGTIERGRPMDTVGAHTYGYNKNSIGINIVGNFEVATPKPEQMEAASRLIASLCTKYQFGPNKYTVQGHRDLCATLCPGENLYSSMNDLRKSSFMYL